VQAGSGCAQVCELGDKGVNVCRMNMSHGDHASHKAVVDKIKEYNKLDRGCMAILLDTKARIRLPQPRV
jgi:pyruvate kinase